jgi:hypothetical protein
MVDDRPAQCEHAFDDRAPVFTATVRARTCRKCNLIEVMVASTGEWMSIEEYLRRRIQDRVSG